MTFQELVEHAAENGWHIGLLPGGDGLAAVAIFKTAEDIFENKPWHIVTMLGNGGGIEGAARALAEKLNQE